MKPFFFLLLLLAGARQASAQDTHREARNNFGLKAGYNVAKLWGANPDWHPQSQNGYMASLFYSPSAHTGLGFRTELVYSHQGFGFSQDGKINHVESDYIYLPQLTTFGIGKFLQLQLGGQVGYLLRSKASGATSGSGNLTSIANRLDYGAAGGVEVYPFKGLILGGRYNVSFGDAYKQNATMPTGLPYDPSQFKGRNAIINFYIGYKF